MQNEKLEFETTLQTVRSVLIKGGAAPVGISKKVMDKMTNRLQFALNIWEDVVSELSDTIKETSFPSDLDRKKKPYALDAILIADALKLDAPGMPDLFKLYTLYYLELHLIDDMMEDQKKFQSKFHNREGISANLNHIEARKLFPILFNLTAVKLISKNNDLSSDKKITVLELLNKSLLKQIRYMSIEKADLTVEQVFEAKEHMVSGEATSTMADLLNTVFDFDGEKFIALKKMLFYLGSLTQFTDDIRDYAEDLDNGNANLLVSLKRAFGEELGIEKLLAMYDIEQSNMKRWSDNFSFSVDFELLSSIPLHPFVVKKLLG